MSTEGWIFMVGFRVFDVGLLIVWLIWFFRLREDGSEPPDDGGGGGGGQGKDPKPSRGPGGGGLALPLGRWSQGGHLRDGHRTGRRPPSRRGAPVTRPLPARVRFPGDPPVRVRGGGPERLSPGTRRCARR